MAYQSLYRRYRSQRFSELRGQDHVTNALQAAVANGRYGHAYLFSGPRGTGKTSTARILAKALNCPNVADGEPCCECESCLAIEHGRSFDLHELDAASHNKVDDIRELISRVNLGSPGRTKVYILDEVHMLSAGAENALLKTLEEPPDHVVFVLATTEPHKVVETIRSRTQHFTFHLLPAEELEEHVRFVIEDAGLDVPDEAIDYVLRQGGGSARDTLSALDLVAAAGGVPAGSDIGVNLARAIADGDAGAAITAVQEGLTQGLEPRVIGETTVGLLRNAFLASMGSTSGHLNDTARTTAEELALQLGPATTTRSLEAIGEALVEMRQAPDPRVPLEVTLLRLCRSTAGGTGRGGSGGAASAVPTAAGPEPAQAPAANGASGSGVPSEVVARLEARIESLENELAGLKTTGLATSTQAPGTETGPTAAAVAKPTDQAGSTPAESQRVGEPAPQADAPDQAGSTEGADAGPSATDNAGPAAGARQRLKETTAKRPPSPRRRAPRTGAGRSQPGSEQPAASDDTADPPESPSPTPSAAQPTSAPAGDGGSALTEADARRAVEVQLEQVSQKVRVRFNVGSVTGVDGNAIVYSIPNVHYKTRCDEVKGELEQAVSAQLGRDVTISVVVDDSSSPTSLDPARRAEPSNRPEESYDDIGPIEELADAVDQSANSVDRLTKAFPGSTVIDHEA